MTLFFGTTRGQLLGKATWDLVFMKKGIVTMLLIPARSPQTSICTLADEWLTGL
jgi:hypothetical protein